MLKTLNHTLLLFEPNHSIPLAVLVVLGIGIYYIAKKNKLTKSQLFWVAMTFPIIDSATYFWELSIGTGDLLHDLPLDLCDICAFILPWAIYKNSHYWLGVLYFWILAGTTQAVITPDIGADFPNPVYFKYWYIHGGLILSILAAIYQQKMHIRKKDAFRAIGWSQVYLIGMLLVNIALQTNFGYIREKPESATILDLMGPWPVYLLVGEGLMIILVVLLYLPWIRSNSRALLHTEGQG